MTRRHRRRRAERCCRRSSAGDVERHDRLRPILAAARHGSARPKLSVVTSLYNSAPFLREFHARASESARRVSPDYEIVLVNDGSPDDSLRIALELHAQDPKVRVIDLSQELRSPQGVDDRAGARAWRAGLPDRLRPGRGSGMADGVPRSAHPAPAPTSIYGVQASRKGGWFERTTGTLFFRVFNHLLTHPIPRNVVTARLMTRQYVRALMRHRDREVCLAGLWVDHRLRSAADDRRQAEPLGLVVHAPPAASRCSSTRSRRSATGR